MDIEKFINENIDYIDEITFDPDGNVKCIKFNDKLSYGLTLYGDEGPTITYRDPMDYFT